jgi:hypothetical protein
MLAAFYIVWLNEQAEAASAEPNDLFLERQTYLGQTHTTDAWSQIHKNEDIVIAIIDTGVDVNHPDLKANLVPGVNLIDPNSPPADDNGHGTNVAGVIAAVGNNNRGVTGMLWKTNLMPIKALEQSGRGEEDKLTAGIRYAVDHGARIVVMSVGLLRNDAYLQETVQYAEDHDVLLVAATGNDEGRNIRYPAAYPTVLAVGGIREDNLIEKRANYGPEIDLVAPWTVFTTAMGGKYEYRDGTSMAAPQVAAAAAMIWAKYPELKVHEVRNLLRQTADDVADAGWDEFTGYGLLRVDRALTEPYNPDIYEPNNNREAAKPYSVGQTITAELSGGTDIDSFYFDSPYDGTLTIKLLSDAIAPSAILVTHTQDANSVVYPYEPDSSIILPVSKGRNELVFQFADNQSPQVWPYRLTSSFAIYEDSFENNDKSYRAYKLSPRNQSLVGTFDHEGDDDWYAVTYDQSGVARVTVTTDTLRIDPVLAVQKQNERMVATDDQDAGEAETYISDVFPGTYYYRVSNMSGSAEIGEYVLQFEFQPKSIDPFEPNNRSFQATVAAFDTVYAGVFDSYADIDYYKIIVTERSLFQLSLTDVPESSDVSVSLQTNGLRAVADARNAGKSSIYMALPVDPGTYYIRLGTSRASQDKPYQLTVGANALVGGYADIRGHWAEAAIVMLTSRGIVEGDGTYWFKPDESVSRAEAIAMMARAFQYGPANASPFSDVPQEHWAYGAVAQAVQAGIVQGYPDGTFRPDQPLSRVEMAALMAHAFGIAGSTGGENPYTDIDADSWALPMLSQLTAEGWINGYDDQTFRPEATATRAEFAEMIKRIFAERNGG